MNKYTKEFSDLDKYQRLARVTANEDSPEKDRILNWTLGIAGEAGEVSDIIKKAMYHGHELDEEEIIKEIGDILWYLANLSFELDTWLGDVATKNIDKLQARYPEGFSKERSVNRSE